MGEADFRITNSDYGSTADIFRCESCGFCQCSGLTDVLDYYVEMEDDAYEATRTTRSIQERRIVQEVMRYKPRGSLLDVGAGSGILVEQAKLLGFDAVGIEPSRALQARASELGLPVHVGVLPHPAITQPFDVVTMINVIEHVPDPVGLVRTISSIVADEGIVVVVTPDRGSLAARLLKWKWWHYRVAHIGYFDRGTLSQALEAGGLTPIEFLRPGWQFPASYILERMMRYSPGRSFRAPALLDRIVVPLNLRDSLLAICRKTPA